MKFTRGKKLTKAGTLEALLYRVFQMACAYILPPSVQSAHIEFRRDTYAVNWRDGFDWLYNPTTKHVRIEAPIKYRSYGGMGNIWVILHDLYHAKQIIDGRLVPRGPGYCKWQGVSWWYVYPDHSGYWSNGSRTVYYHSTPWELEANRKADSIKERLKVPANQTAIEARKTLKELEHGHET